MDETKRARLEEALRWLDSFMKGRTWQATDHFTIADLALCVTVSQVEAFGMSLNPYAKVKQWLKMCKQHLEPFGYDVSVLKLSLKISDLILMNSFNFTTGDQPARSRNLG